MNISDYLTKEDYLNTMTALKSYNFFLLQVSKSKIRPVKERKNAEKDIYVIDNLIEKFKNMGKEF